MKGAIKMEGLCLPSECLSVGPLLTHLNAALQREGLGGSVTKRLCPLIPPLLCRNGGQEPQGVLWGRKPCLLGMVPSHRTTSGDSQAGGGETAGQPLPWWHRANSLPPTVSSVLPVESEVPPTRSADQSAYFRKTKGQHVSLDRILTQWLKCGRRRAFLGEGTSMTSV